MDFDQDGDIDLFRGGQVVPHGYPKTPVSYVLVNEKGKFLDRSREIAGGLAEVGMVNSAIFIDLDGDKKNELVVVGEWMPVTIFSFMDGKFNDVTSRYIGEKTEGWWSKVFADDLDGEGDQDLILGNIGENYKFREC